MIKKTILAVSLAFCTAQAVPSRANAAVILAFTNPGGPEFLYGVGLFSVPFVADLSHHEMKSCMRNVFLTGGAILGVHGEEDLVETKLDLTALDAPQQEEIHDLIQYKLSHDQTTELNDGRILIQISREEIAAIVAKGDYQNEVEIVNLLTAQFQ